MIFIIEKRMSYYFNYYFKYFVEYDYFITLLNFIIVSLNVLIGDIIFIFVYAGIENVVLYEIGFEFPFMLIMDEVSVNSIYSVIVLIVFNLYLRLRNRRCTL